MTPEDDLAGKLRAIWNGSLGIPFSAAEIGRAMNIDRSTVLKWVGPRNEQRWRERHSCPRKGNAERVAAFLERVNGG